MFSPFLTSPDRQQHHSVFPEAENRARQPWQRDGITFTRASPALHSIAGFELRRVQPTRRSPPTYLPPPNKLRQGSEVQALRGAPAGSRPPCPRMVPQGRCEIDGHQARGCSNTNNAVVEQAELSENVYRGAMLLRPARPVNRLSYSKGDDGVQLETRTTFRACHISRSRGFLRRFRQT